METQLLLDLSAPWLLYSLRGAVPTELFLRCQNFGMHDVRQMGQRGGVESSLWPSCLPTAGVILGSGLAFTKLFFCLWEEKILHILRVFFWIQSRNMKTILWHTCKIWLFIMVNHTGFWWSCILRFILILFGSAPVLVNARWFFRDIQHNGLF